MATSSSVISGTPRMNSMKPTESDLTMNMSERRPSASRMPSGSEKAMPVMPMVTDSMKPPKSLEATGVSASGTADAKRAGHRPDEIEPPDERRQHRRDRPEPGPYPAAVTPRCTR